jgi:AcrR family transcriptional regulator
MSARTQQRLETRRRLLEAARRQFEAQGFEGTALRDLAQEAGVALGTVFVHFHDKRDLLHAALYEDLEQRLAAALSGGPPGLAPWLEHVAQVFFGYYAERPALSRVLLRESLLAEPPWRERFAEQHARVHAEIVARFEAARVRGEVQGDAGLFGLSFLAFLNFTLLWWANQGHPDPVGVVRRLVAQQLTGASA